MLAPGRTHKSISSTSSEAAFLMVISFNAFMFSDAIVRWVHLDRRPGGGV